MDIGKEFWLDLSINAMQSKEIFNGLEKGQNIDQIEIHYYSVPFLTVKQISIVEYKKHLAVFF
jgi:hypothetical protein